MGLASLVRFARRRLGGTANTGFFVPPQTASYTFHLHTHGTAKVWLSPSGSPEDSREILAATSSSLSTASPASSRRRTSVPTPVQEAFLENPPMPFVSEDEMNERRLTYSADLSRRVSPGLTGSADDFVSSESFVLTAGKPYYFRMEHSSSASSALKLLSVTISKQRVEYSTTTTVTSHLTQNASLFEGAMVNGTFVNFTHAEKENVRLCEEQSDKISPPISILSYVTSLLPTSP